MIGGVDFNAENHTYSKAGIPIPGVSSILDFMRLFPGKHFYKPEHAMRGTYVHTITELIDNNTLDWKTLDPSLRGYADAYQEFVSEQSFKWEYTEQKLFNEELWYCGTTDRIGDFRNEPSVVDFKSGKGTLVPAHGVQTAAYDMCIPGPNRKRWIVYLRPNGTYKIYECEDKTDYAAFKHGAWLYQWSKGKKLI